MDKQTYPDPRARERAAGPVAYQPAGTRHWAGTIVAILATLLLVAGILALLATGRAGAAPRVAGIAVILAAPRVPRVATQSHPLDCILWTITDDGGAGPRTRWLICSAIPKDQGGDSPARDSTNWHHYIIDGGPAFPNPPNCGQTWAEACVMF